MIPVTSFVSIVVPVFNNQSGLDELVKRINLSDFDFAYELVFVDDGSKDDSWGAIKRIVAASDNSSGIKLSRNFGQHNALLAGIRAAQGDYIVTLDDDLQFSPEDILSLMKALINEKVDIVYGLAQSSENARWRELSSRALKGLLSKIFAVSDAKNLSSFRLFKAHLRNGFSDYVGPNVSIDALLAWSSSRSTSVRVSHSSRFNGKSNYTWRKLVAHAIDIMSSYSARPLRFASLTGLVASVFGFILLFETLLKALVFGSAVPGFTFLASAVTVFAGIQLLTLGIIGEYLLKSTSER